MIFIVVVVQDKVLVCVVDAVPGECGQFSVVIAFGQLEGDKDRV
jgi:hypothetical protein